MPDEKITFSPKRNTFDNTFSSNSSDFSEIDRELQNKRLSVEEASDKAYREITKEIITLASKELQERRETKKPLRQKLLNFITLLLSLQLVFLFFLLLLISLFNVALSDFVINSYIISVFAETLTGLIVMVKFAFDSTEETKLIQIVNTIVKRFQKYSGHTNK